MFYITFPELRCNLWNGPLEFGEQYLNDVYLHLKVTLWISWHSSALIVSFLLEKSELRRKLV